MKNVCGETETLPSLTKTHQGCEGQMCQGSNHRHTAEMSLLLLQTFWQPALFVVCVRARYEWMLHF